MEKKYCCEDMRIAVEDWGGVWIEEDGEWWIERDGDLDPTTIDSCPWCKASLKAVKP